MIPWQRTYWVVYAANLITAVGMMSFLPFFPSFLEELGVEERAHVQRWTGVAFGAAPLAAAVMGPVWGSIGDRWSRKLMVLRAMFAIALFVGAMGFVRTPWQLLALRLCQGIFSGFVPPSITLVSVAAPREAQGRISGGLQGALALGSILGPLYGGFVREHLGMRGVFLSVSALSLASALLVGLLATDAPQKSVPASGARWSPTGVLRDVLSDLGEALRLRSVRAALLVLFAAQLGSSAVSPQVELLVRDVWRGPAQELAAMTALAVSAFAGASLFAMPAWGRLGDRIGHGRALVLCALLGALALALHVPVRGYAALVLVRLFIGLTISGTSANAFGIMGLETAAERRGSAIGAAFSARAFAMAFGAMGGGVLAGALGMRWTFALCALGVFLGTLLAWAWMFQPPQDVVGMDPRARQR